MECKIFKTINPPLKNKPVSPARFSQLEIDVVGPLPQSEGQRYLLTIICRTTRWVDALPMPEATAENCVKAFIRGWVKQVGLPFEAVSDNGNTFISKIWKGLHESIGTLVKYTPLYSPSSLGLAERQHREIKTGLKACLLTMANEAKDRWMDCLPWVILNRRTVYQPTLGASSAELVYGSCPVIPGDLVRPQEKVNLQDLLKKTPN